MTSPLLKLTEINKSFGPIDVLHDISLDVYRAEVLCLLGDNGAGKSTLIKILSGVHRPTSGKLEMEGKAIEFSSPRDASDHGIATEGHRRHLYHPQRRPRPYCRGPFRGPHPRRQGRRFPQG